MVDDTRRLIPMQIKKVGENLYAIDIDGAESYKVEASLDEIKRALRRIKAKDGENCGKCKSKKVNSYLNMIGDGDDELHKINVWKSKVPHSASEFKSLMENKIMKKITLTKNYLVEGNIIPKGTVVEFKEKLDFLPADIWDKACDIEDEHERFEFIKAELNKLGDDYSDDEIEDFINKYKNELNESVKKLSKEDLNEMLEVIEETVKSEKVVDASTLENILKKAEKDKTLIEYWGALVDADDKTFNKKESEFWNMFDKFIVQFKLKNVA